jgi:hypothetical protein
MCIYNTCEMQNYLKVATQNLGSKPVFTGMIASYRIWNDKF